MDWFLAGSSFLKDLLIIQEALCRIRSVISFLAVLMKCREVGVGGNHREERNDCNVTRSEKKRRKTGLESVSMGSPWCRTELWYVFADLLGVNQGSGGGRVSERRQQRGFFLVYLFIFGELQENGEMELCAALLLRSPVCWRNPIVSHGALSGSLPHLTFISECVRKTPSTILRTFIIFLGGRRSVLFPFILTGVTKKAAQSSGELTGSRPSKSHCKPSYWPCAASSSGLRSRSILGAPHLQQDVAKASISPLCAEQHAWGLIFRCDHIV